MNTYRKSRVRHLVALETLGAISEQECNELEHLARLRPRTQKSMKQHDLLTQRRRDAALRKVMKALEEYAKTLEM